MSFAFNDLLGDIGTWFLLGVVIAGLIGVFLPASFIEAHLGEGFMPMVIMLIVGIPLYVCATATTPIAAALALKGLSPGAALVFLLAGPATNAASLAVVSRILGKKATALYLAAIAACSLVLGVAANYFYGMLGFSVTDWVQKSHSEHYTTFAQLSAVLLLALILKAYCKKYFPGSKPCACNDEPRF